MQIADISARIEARVPQLAGRIQDASAFQKMLQTSAALSASGGAFVMPSGLSGGRVQAMAGAFLQDIATVIAVVLVVPDANPMSGRAGGTIDARMKAVIEAICGWTPPDAPGPFALLRGAMINLGAGVLAFQLEFSIADFLRINPT